MSFLFKSVIKNSKIFANMKYFSLICKQDNAAYVIAFIL